jgi:teichuronic acid exporter
MSRTVSSGKWAFLTSSSQQTIGFIFFGAMTYLLSPKYFGIYAIGLIFTEILSQVARLGFSVNLINRKKSLNFALNNAFWITLLVGLCVSSIFYYSSPFIAKYFDIADNVNVIQILTVVPIIFALGCVPDALLQRQFLYKKIAFATLLANVISCLLALVVALTDFGVIAFAFQKVVYECLKLAIIWRSVRWRPRWLIDSSTLNGQFKIGFPLLIAGLTNVTSNKLKDIFIASILGPTSLGIYRLAVKLQDFVVKLALGPVTEVAIPSLARVNKDDFYSETGKFMSWLATLSFPLFFGMLVTAPELLNVLFNDSWVGSTHALQLLCILGVFSIYVHMFKPIFSVLEQGRYLLILRLCQLVFLLALLYLFSSYGLLYIIAAEIIVTITITILGLYALSKILNLNAFFLLFQVKPALLSSMFMLFIIIFSKALLHLYLNLNDTFILIILILVGAMSYLLFFKLIFNEQYIIAVKNMEGGKFGHLIKKFS